MERIIVRMPNWLGDCVMASAILTDLRAAFPKAEITLLLPHALTALFEKDPRVNTTLGFYLINGFLRRRAIGELIDRLQIGKYDLGLLLPNSFSSAYWFWKAKIPRRIGFSDHWRRLLLTDPVPFPREREKQHLVDTYRALLEAIAVPTSSSNPKLYLTEEEKREAKAMIEQWMPFPKRIVGMHATAAYGPAKCWPKERYIALILQLLQEPSTMVLLFGDQKSVPDLSQILLACQKKDPHLSQRLVNLAGATTLRQLMALTSGCSVFVTNDSGPMHLADALGVPVVALFGSTNPVVTGPYRTMQSGQGALICKHVHCAPCYLRHCPTDFRCMKQIQVNEVFNAIQRCFSSHMDNGAG